jgi:hypothetical protein
MEYMRDVVLQ